jgi:hypothetical protein
MMQAYGVRPRAASGKKRKGVFSEGEFTWGSTGGALTGSLSVPANHRPVFKIYTPEMRCRRQKLHPHTRSSVARFSQEDDAAFLFFLRFRVHQDQHFAIIDVMAQVQQATMSAHHQCFTDFAKFAAFVAAPERLHAHLVKDALAAAL